MNETVTELMRFPSGLRPDHGQTVMYGPPPCRKRKMKVTGWSAQMYSAFVGA